MGILIDCIYPVRTCDSFGVCHIATKPHAICLQRDNYYSVDCRARIFVFRLEKGQLIVKRIFVIAQHDINYKIRCTIHVFMI